MCLGTHLRHRIIPILRRHDQISIRLHQWKIHDLSRDCHPDLAANQVALHILIESTTNILDRGTLTILPPHWRGIFDKKEDLWARHTPIFGNPHRQRTIVL
jgi:hypothetical protein